MCWWKKSDFSDNSANGFKMLIICTAICLQTAAPRPQTATDKL